MQRTVHEAMVTHCGYNRNTAKAVIYGVPQWGGAAFTHLYDIQGYGQISYFLKSWRSPNTHQGKMIRIALHWAQFCAGVSFPILEYPERPLHQVEAIWLMSLRKYLQAINGSIHIIQPGVPSKQRDHDEYIMDIVMKMEKLKPGQIRRINYCRLYLNVTTLSDITNATGDTIDPAAIAGKKDQMQAHSTWQEIHQQNPDKISWSLWRKVLRQVSYRQGRQHRLIQPLGQWTILTEHMRQAWHFWQDPSTNKLYHQIENEIREYRRLWYDYDCDEYTITNNIPRNAVPVDVEDNGVTWRVKAHHNTWAPQRNPQAELDIRASTQQMDEWERQLLQGMEILVAHDIFLHQITQPMMIACDGSVQDHRASYGWIMSTTDGTRLAKCTGPAYGYRPTSFRAEGYGILSAVRFIHLSQKKWNALSQYTIICDNEAIVNIMQEQHRVEDTYTNQRLNAEWDVIAETTATIEADALWEKVTFRHIKGHADRNTAHHKLTVMQQLNVEADKLADEYIQQNQDLAYSIVPILPTSGVQLNMAGGTVTHRLKQTVMQARSQQEHKKYLCKKNAWTQEEFETIDWESHRQALNRHQPQRTILTKYLNNMVPVGQRVHTYDPKYPAGCPSCPEEQETQEHMLKCPCIHRTAWREKFVKAIKTILDEYQTPAQVQTLMMESLSDTLGLSNTPNPQVPPELAPIAAAQAAIGWEQMMKGRFAKEWKAHQHTVMQGSETKYKNAQTWSTTIIQTIFQQWLDLWTIRNTARHGRDWKSKRLAAKEQALRELEQLYEYKGQIMPHDEWIFHTSLALQQQKSTYVLRAFINNYKPVILKSYQTRLETG
jgi:hypothetical protein